MSKSNTDQSLHLPRSGRRAPFKYWLIVGLMFMGTISCFAQTRESGVQAARDGRLEEGISVLRKLMESGDNDPILPLDLAVILTWANRPSEAVVIFEKAAPVDAPEYVLLAVTRAYRNLKRFSQAERMAREGMQRFPDQPVWVKLLALILIDSGKPKEAIELLEPLLKNTPEDGEGWLARGYAASRAGDRFGALRAYGQAMALLPENREAPQAMARLMRELGAPYAAASLLGEVPLSIEAQQAGLMVRWGGTIFPDDPARRFDDIDKALVRLDQLIRKAKAESVDDVLLALRRDQIVALRMRERWADTVKAAEELRSQGKVLPAYVMLAEADSLLALQRPSEALAIYLEILKTDPKSRNARIGAFYAQVETEDFKAAFHMIDTLASENTPKIRMPNQRFIEPNYDWLDAQVLMAQSRSYADMQAEAWKRLLPLAQGAPVLGYLRSALGAVAAARGWPHLAEEEIQIASSLAPYDRGIQVALAESALRRGKWRDARERIEKLVTEFPDDAYVQRVQKDLATHDSWELQSSFRVRLEEESDGAAPGPGVEGLIRLYSQPLGEDWRVFAASEIYTADVPEGKAERFCEGIGIELRVPDFAAELSVWNNHGTVDKFGLSASAFWTPDDHWKLSTKLESFSKDTPLRALLYGITANSGELSLGYDWSESTALSLSVRMLDFSDGNQREEARLSFAQRLIDRPHFDLTLRPSIYASRNSLLDAPYFNPEQDLSAMIALDAEHVIWRRYDRSFGQRLILSGGNYWQANYGNDWVGSVTYEQVFKHNRYGELRYGVEVGQNVYDGNPTGVVLCFINLSLRF